MTRDGGHDDYLLLSAVTCPVDIDRPLTLPGLARGPGLVRGILHAWREFDEHPDPDRALDDALAAFQGSPILVAAPVDPKASFLGKLVILGLLRGGWIT